MSDLYMSYKILESNEMHFKTCTKCGETLPATTEYFYKHKSCKYGLSGKCKKCIAEQQKQYYEANKEKVAERHKQYYENNKEKVAEQSKRYREENKELNNTTDFIRDARILLSKVPVKNKEQFEKAFKEINERMSKRVDKYEQLRDKVSKMQDKFNDAKLATIGFSGVPLTAAGTYGIYKYDTNINLK